MTEVVREGLNIDVNRTTRRCTWAGLDADDSGQAHDLSAWPDKTMQVFGTFGGATMTLYGSNDPRVLVDRAAGTLFGAATAKWVICKDNLDNNIAKLAAGGDVQIENYQFYTPVNTGGDGTTSLTVIIVGSRSRI